MTFRYLLQLILSLIIEYIYSSHIPQWTGQRHRLRQSKRQDSQELLSCFPRPLSRLRNYFSLSHSFSKTLTCDDVGANGVADACFTWGSRFCRVSVASMRQIVRVLAGVRSVIITPSSGTLSLSSLALFHNDSAYGVTIIYVSQCTSTSIGLILSPWLSYDTFLSLDFHLVYLSIESIKTLTRASLQPNHWTLNKTIYKLIILRLIIYRR